MIQYISVTCWRVGTNHLPVVVVINGRDDELRAPMWVDESPTVVDVDDAVVVRTFHTTTQTISGTFHFALHYTAWDALGSTTQRHMLTATRTATRRSLSTE